MCTSSRTKFLVATEVNDHSLQSSSLFSLAYSAFYAVRKDTKQYYIIMLTEISSNPMTNLCVLNIRLLIFIKVIKIIEILQKCQVKESPIPGAGSGNFAAQVCNTFGNLNSMVDPSNA